MTPYNINDKQRIHWSSQHNNPKLPIARHEYIVSLHVLFVVMANTTMIVRCTCAYLSSDVRDVRGRMWAFGGGACKRGNVSSFDTRLIRKLYGMAELRLCVVLWVAIFFQNSVISYCAPPSSTPGGSSAPTPVPPLAKRYTVNLDLPPEQRWVEVVKDHEESIVQLLQSLKSALPSELSSP